VIGTNSNPKHCVRRTRERIKKLGGRYKRRPLLPRRRKRSVHLTVALQSGMPNDNRRHRQTLNRARLMKRYLRSMAGSKYVGIIKGYPNRVVFTGFIRRLRWRLLEEHQCAMRTQACDQSRRHEHICIISLSITRSDRCCRAGLDYRRATTQATRKSHKEFQELRSDAALPCLSSFCPPCPIPPSLALRRC
jgi:hypothetical protein